MERYAVVGNPIEHSKSPLIHAEFARQTGEQLTYERLLAPLDDFAGTVRAFVAAGGRGLNVTVPFKEQAWRLVDSCGMDAALAEAVNTIVVEGDGKLRGENTDGVGLVRDLVANQGFEFAGKRVLLVGAGGAARGVLRPLIATGPAELVVANRTVERAVALVERLAGSAPVRARGLDALGGESFDLIIDATSAGLGGAPPALPDDCLAPDGWVYDLLYGDEATPFMRWGAARGAARVLGGIGMLVEQAAESFALWRGRRPHTAELIARLGPSEDRG